MIPYASVEIGYMVFSQRGKGENKKEREKRKKERKGKARKIIWLPE